MRKCKYGHDLTSSNLYTYPKSGYKSCRVCRVTMRKAHYKANRDKTREYDKIAYMTKRRDKVVGNPKELVKRRENYLNRVYGLSMKDFDELRECQDNKCALCMKSFVKTPQVDHCHTTNKVRGLLCNRCNVGVGYMEVFIREPELADRIKVYLED